MDTSASLAGNKIAISEMAAEIGIILGGFISGDESNDLITRLSGTLVVLIMCAPFYFYVMHSEVIPSFELFKNEKISLSAFGMYCASEAIFEINSTHKYVNKVNKTLPDK